MAGGGGDQETNLEFTPTWVVALVCTFIVAISLFVERIIHYAGKVMVNPTSLNWLVLRWLSSWRGALEQW